MDPERKDFSKWWLLSLGLIVVSVIVLTGLNYVGIIGSTAVERVVFEQSYQRDAAYKARIATFEAQLAESQARLDNPNTPETTRQEIQAQMAAVRVQLSAARSQQ